MKKAPLLFTLLPTLIILAGCHSDHSFSQQSQVNASETTSTSQLNYSDYETTLSTYVDDQGLVNYQALQAKREALDNFNSSFATVTPSTYATWSEAQQLAFWINAYNSFTLQSIIDQNPLKESIKDIFGVWKINKWPILDQQKTLDNIEHKTIRADFNEPRIHVALVCAAVSCPPLRNEPYTATQLDAQLDDQTRKFIASPQGFRIDRAEGTVYLSKIFEWYGDDWIDGYGIDDKFTGRAGQRAVLNFISAYLPEADQEYLARGNYKIKYLNYDWSLNKQ